MTSLPDSSTPGQVKLGRANRSDFVTSRRTNLEQGLQDLPIRAAGYDNSH